MPDEADLVVVGNPTNPTAVLHAREELLALRRPGRTIVVDEAFADAVPGEPSRWPVDSLPDVRGAAQPHQDVVAGRLAGRLRAGLAGALARLTAARAHWPVGTLQLEAIASCSTPEAVAEAARRCARAGAAARGDWWRD